MTVSLARRDRGPERPPSGNDQAANLLRGVAERRLKRLREGMPWVRDAHPLLVEAYGSVVDLDFGWRMVDAALRKHREGKAEFTPACREALVNLWETLIAEILRAPRRDEPDDARAVARELREAVQERLHRMRQLMARDDGAAIHMMREYESLIDLDLGWRMIEAALDQADSGEAPLDGAQRESLEAGWRDLTTELVAILGRSREAVEARPALLAAPGAPADNMIAFSRAA